MKFFKNNKTVFNIIWSCLMATCCGVNIYWKLPFEDPHNSNCFYFIDKNQ